MKIYINIIFIFLINFFTALEGYGIPGVNLGIASILDGGPIRPSPGFYFFQYAHYYYANKFTDCKGLQLKGVDHPHFNYLSGVTELVYQTEDDFIFNAAGGLSLVIPYILYSHIDKNKLGIKDKGAGLSNIEIGGYLQWKPIIYKDRPLFVHRLEVDFIPKLKNKDLINVIYPAANFNRIENYWAATFYITQKLALSWRLNYLKCFKDKKTQIKIGDVFYANYSLVYETIKNLWLGINGYYLQQLQNNKSFDQIIPNTKERVVGLGPGAAYFFSKYFVFFAHLYFESNVRNRPKGISFATNIVLHF